MDNLIEKSLPSMLYTLKGSVGSKIGEKKYKKHILRSGIWNDVAVGPSNLKYIAQTFKQMRASGVKIPIPMEHIDENLPWEKKKKLIAETNKGWVDSIDWDEKDPDNLYAQYTINDDKINMDNLDVSVNIEKIFTDGGGKQWISPLTHLALKDTQPLHYKKQ